MKLVIALLVLCLVAIAPASAQDKVFDWTPANSEAVRLDPGYYHAGHVYRPGPDGGNMHVDIESEKPVTIGLAPEGQWNDAMQHTERMRDVSFLCMQEHVVKTTYTCHIPAQAMVLVIHDERASTDQAVHAGLGELRKSDDSLERVAAIGIGAVLSGSGSVPHRFVSPNDLHIQYYSWTCVENCYQPEFRWFEKAKEKYELTSILKVYSGIFPDHDGEQISVTIKSPVPMAVAVIPSAVASQLYESPGMFEPAMAKSSCQQRGIQSLTWQCPLNQADGPQSVVVVPEMRDKVPHKKAEIHVYETQCVANCGPPPEQRAPIKQ